MTRNRQAKHAESDSRILLRRIGTLWVTYVKGQLLLSMIIGGLTWLVAAAIGLPGAGWLGLLSGMLETIPSLGPLVATIPAATVALLKGSTVIPVQNWVFCLIVIGVYIVIQQVTSLFIEPHVMGKRLDLPPLVVLVAVIAGALIANIVGAYLAVPTLVTAREIVRYFRNRAAGRPPFPPEQDETSSKLDA